MRVFVAGIRIAKEHENASLADKVAYVTALLATINADAKRKEVDGEESLVFVVMCEYALTSEQAEPYEDLNVALEALKGVMKQYPNMILIPGSCASFEDLLANEDQTGIERRRSESAMLLHNYKMITSDPELCTRFMIVKARDDLNKKLANDPDISTYLFLRNAAHVITPNGNVTRNKSIPYFEYKKLPNQAQDSIFYIGNPNPIVKVGTSCGELNLGLLLCIEQSVLTLPAGLTQHELPIFQVVVSASIEMNYDNLFAAITIQMDSKDDLKVVVNYNHCHADKIEHIDCYVYDSDNHQQCTQQSGIIGFAGKEYNDEQLAAIPAPQPIADEPEFARIQRNPRMLYRLNETLQAWPRRQVSDSDLPSATQGSGRSLNNSNN